LTKSDFPNKTEAKKGGPQYKVNVKGGSSSKKKGLKQQQEEDEDGLLDEDKEDMDWLPALVVLTERGKLALFDRCIPPHPVAIYALNVS